jgi:hypothetical protein
MVLHKLALAQGSDNSAPARRISIVKISLWLPSPSTHLPATRLEAVPANGGLAGFLGLRCASVAHPLSDRAGRRSQGRADARLHSALLHRAIYGRRSRPARGQRPR